MRMNIGSTDSARAAYHKRPHGLNVMGPFPMAIRPGETLVIN